MFYIRYCVSDITGNDALREIWRCLCLKVPLSVIWADSIPFLYVIRATRRSKRWRKIFKVKVFMTLFVKPNLVNDPRESRTTVECVPFERTTAIEWRVKERRTVMVTNEWVNTKPQNILIRTVITEPQWYAFIFINENRNFQQQKYWIRVIRWSCSYRSPICNRYTSSSLET